MVGMADEKYGEEVAAFVKVKKKQYTGPLPCGREGEGGEAAVTAEDVREFCRMRLAHFKVKGGFILFTM